MVIEEQYMEANVKWDTNNQLSIQTINFIFSNAYLIKYY